MRFLIVGLHAAGRSACAWLRRLCPSAEIVGVDPHADPPYARPLISHVLAGEAPPALLDLKERSFFADQGVQLVPERAAGLDHLRRVLVLESGKELHYDRLLAATGSAPRRVDAAGAAAGEICYFRTREDLARLSALIKPGGTAAVLGGGLVGFKLTMGLLARGMKVTLIVASPRPLSLNVDQYVGEAIGRRLADLPGVELWTNASLARMEPGSAARYRLTLEDGRSLDADLVAAGKGVEPAADWLAQSGLDTRGGVLAGPRLESAAPGVYVAGDLARVHDLVHLTPQVNAIWPLAVEQGRYAAWNMAGRSAPYPGGLAMNAIPVLGSLMVSVGAVNPRHTAGCEELTCEPRKGSYLNLVFREGRLIGAVGLDAPPRLGELAWAVRSGLRRERIPRSWLDNPQGAAPLAAGGLALAGLA